MRYARPLRLLFVATPSIKSIAVAKCPSATRALYLARKWALAFCESYHSPFRLNSHPELATAPNKYSTSAWAVVGVAAATRDAKPRPINVMVIALHSAARRVVIARGPATGSTGVRLSIAAPHFEPVLDHT